MGIAFVVVLAVAGLAEDAPSGAERVAASIPDLASGDAGRVDRAWTALESACFAAGRPGAEAERKAVALAIASRLGDETPVETRRILLRALEGIGKGEVIPALAKLLAPGNDPALRDGARRALEANPHVNAKKELRAALSSADGALKAGILRALGARRDFLASADIIEAAGDKDPVVRLAALEALADIGDIASIPVLDGALAEPAGLDLTAVRSAYLRLADSLVRNGERGPARRLYDKASGMGPTYRAAALIGFARAGLQSEVERIVTALGDPDPVVRAAAAEAAGILPGPAMTKALLAKAAGAKAGEARKPVLEVLARRGGPEAVAAILAFVKSSASASDRASALRWLDGKAIASRLDDALPILFTAVEKGGDEASAAGECLLRLPGAGALLARAAESDSTGARRAALLRAVAAQHDTAHAEEVRSLAKDAVPQVRQAALRALGDLVDGAVDGASLAVLLSAVQSGDAGDRDAASGSLVRLPGENVGSAILAALPSTQGAAKAALLKSLGQRRTPGALEALRAAVADTDPLVKSAAVEGLARLDDPSVLPVLLEVAKSGQGPAQEAAIRGSLRFADALAREKKEPEAATIYTSALQMARGDDELRVALRGLAETGGADSLEKVLPYLKPGPVQRDAGRAALRLAERLPDSRQAEARQVYEKVLEANPDGATASQCVRRLRRLGVDVDLARKAGFVTHWWILAPIANTDGSLFEKALPPETAVDLSKPLEVSGQSLAWKAHHTPDARGFVVLEEAGYPESNVGAYLYAEIISPDARPALLKLGSDDQVVCWLNGKKVHTHATDRGLEADQDTIEVELLAGVNRVLLKVLNDGGGWGACLRITDHSGRPLQLEQRAK